MKTEKIYCKILDDEIGYLTYIFTYKKKQYTIKTTSFDFTAISKVKEIYRLSDSYSIIYNTISSNVKETFVYKNVEYTFDTNVTLDSIDYGVEIIKAISPNISYIEGFQSYNNEYDFVIGFLGEIGL